jgi:hypothetical protein
MDWTNLAQDREQWLALVNAAMDSGFHKMLGISRVVEQLLVSEEGPAA